MLKEKLTKREKGLISQYDKLRKGGNKHLITQKHKDAIAKYYRIRRLEPGVAEAKRAASQRWKKKTNWSRQPKTRLQRRKWYQKYISKPENLRKERVRLKLRYAVKVGRIIKPDRCEKCKKKTLVLDGHHHDYDKPYDVTWLCKTCHGKEHRKHK